MSHILRKLKKNNEGSSFLMVIIGVIFVAMIGVIMLSIATNYLVTAIVDEKSTDNFYDAEAVLAEVKTGLVEVANDCTEEAYKEAVEKYSANSGLSRTEAFSEKYLMLLAEKLTGGHETISWPDKTKPATFSADLPTIRQFVGKNTEEHEKMVQAASGSVLSVVLNKSDEGEYTLSLNNLLIDFQRDKSEYKSTINTNIVVRVPDLRLDGDSTFNELKKYIVICDDTLSVESGASGGVSFSGNVYTGNKEDGILIDSTSKASFNSDKIITRGDVNVKSGADLTLSGKNASSLGDLWAQNLKVTPKAASTMISQKSSVDINMNSYISNDTSIDDDNTTVNIGGNYYGYSYNKDNTSTTGTFNADYSSAILINGRNTTLKANGLESMILAGRSFVSRNDSALTKITSDIMMGESIALKSNQIAYLVPSDYISVGHNPALAYEKSTVSVDATALRNSDIGTYLNYSQPYTKNYLQSGFVYFYLNFKNEQAANDYFSQYYSNSDHMKSVIEKARTYIATTDDTGMQIDAALWLIAGNVIKNYKENAVTDLSVEQPSYYDGTNPNYNLLEDGKTKGKEYVGRQLTLLPRGGTTMRLPDGAPALVPSKIIDYSKVNSVVNKYYADIDATFYVAPSGITLTPGLVKRGIIVANGNVNVGADFEGLIISNGKVKVTVDGVDAKANITLVRDLLAKIIADPDLKKYFIGADSFDGGKSPKVNIADYVGYENWQKNSN